MQLEPNFSTIPYVAYCADRECGGPRVNYTWERSGLESVANLVPEQEYPVIISLLQCCPLYDCQHLSATGICTSSVLKSLSILCIFTATKEATMVKRQKDRHLDWWHMSVDFWTSKYGYVPSKFKGLGNSPLHFQQEATVPMVTLAFPSIRLRPTQRALTLPKGSWTESGSSAAEFSWGCLFQKFTNFWGSMEKWT